MPTPPHRVLIAEDRLGEIKGIGCGVKNYLAYGGFPQNDGKTLLPRGVNTRLTST